MAQPLPQVVQLNIEAVTALSSTIWILDKAYNHVCILHCTECSGHFGTTESSMMFSFFQ